MEDQGLLKIQLGSVKDEVQVLRNKSKLASHDGEYRNAYLRSSKTHTERLINLKFRTLLRELPNGRNYRVAGNGRVVSKEDGDMYIRNRSQLSSQLVPQTMDTQTASGNGTTRLGIFSQTDFPIMSQADDA